MLFILKSKRKGQLIFPTRSGLKIVIITVITAIHILLLIDKSLKIIMTPF